MGIYSPLNYGQINTAAGLNKPSSVKSYNNKTFEFWERSLFQRACSVLEFDLPEEWQGSIKDFFYYCLFRYGKIAISENAEFGLFFQPCTLNGFNFYYQPVEALISNPRLNARLTIGQDCEILKLTPDYEGIWDIIEYYAEKLSILDNAINMSLINNKYAFFMGAKNKPAAEAIKKMFDKVNAGEPAVIFDTKLMNDPTDKGEPWQFLERKNLKESYLTSDQLMDFQTLLNNFDTEIGIPVLPYQKKERMVTSEAESKIIDATSRSIVWLETLNSCIRVINNHYKNLNLSVKLRYNPEERQVLTNGDNLSVGAE